MPFVHGFTLMRGGSGAYRFESENLVSVSSSLVGSQAIERPISGIDTPVGGGSLKVCAFNIQVLGTKKMGKEEVVKTLVKILQRY